MANPFPILWVGPVGSGKLTAAREAFGYNPVEEPRLRTLVVCDFEVRYWEFSSHMEIDILDLSMKDKEILPELLSQLLASRDVVSASSKQLLLRRIHGLSPAAAQRFRACLEEYVWSSRAPAVVSCTARTFNAVVAIVQDGFVVRRCSKTSVSELNGVPDAEFYMHEMVQQMVCALNKGPPCLDAILWLRARVYDILGMMVVGSDLVAGMTWAVVRLAAAGKLETARAKRALDVLAQTRWIPSYRTPLMLETLLLGVYHALRVKTKDASRDIRG